jgi:hypothetical protein
MLVTYRYPVRCSPGYYGTINVIVRFDVYDCARNYVIVAGTRDCYVYSIRHKVRPCYRTFFSGSETIAIYQYHL